MDVFERLFAATAAIVIPTLIVMLGVTVLVIISMWTIFKKAGKEGWEALIPGYNTATLCDITGFTPYLGFIVLGYFIPFINSLVGLAMLALHVVTSLKLAEAFGKKVEYAIGLIFLPVIFFPMLAFDKEAKYNANYKFKGVGFSNYTNGSSTNATNDNNTFYAENENNTQETTTEAQPSEGPVQEVNPVEPTNTVDANVDPIQNNDNNNNMNGQW